MEALLFSKPVIFIAGIALGAGFHRFWSRAAIKAYKGVKGRF